MMGPELLLHAAALLHQQRLAASETAHTARTGRAERTAGVRERGRWRRAAAASWLGKG